MQDLLWFLLPIAAFSGWMVANRTRQKSSTTGSSQSELTAGYYEGINYLLNEQPDKAVDVFVKMLEVNSETVELHLALGSLFRRRGEVDRAILLHQNLIARPTLDNRQKEHALLELARDYLKAGLLDRAERLFLDLKSSKSYTDQALEGLIDVYQQEKDWEQAISNAKSYQRVTGKKQGRLIAQLYCELAEKTRQVGNKDKIPGIVKKALSADPRCIRANIILAYYEIDMFNYKAASKALLNVIDQDPRFIPIVIEPLKTCYEKLGESTQLFRHLGSIVGSRWYRENLSLLRSQHDHLSTEQQTEELVKSQLVEAPSIKTLSQYIELLTEKDNVAHDDVLFTIRNVLERVMDNSSEFRCVQCGYASKALFWQCPSCKAWDSVEPL